MTIMKNVLCFSATAMICFLMAACSSFRDDTDPFDTQEAVKDLSGVWKISNVTRNGVDITDNVDFTSFALHLESDGTYRIENYLPFVVKADGTWATDDPQYPFMLSFHEQGEADTTSVELVYPNIDGQRNLLINLSPGCSSNTYVYTMKRDSN